MTASLVKDAIWPLCNYSPHGGGQRDIHNSLARHRVASCGRRYGKSRVGGMELIPEALLTQALMPVLDEGRRFWIVGPNYDDCEREWRVLYEAAKKLELPFDKPGTYNDVIGGNMQMSLWDGKFMVECRSAAHPESLDGEGLNGVIMVEAAKMKPNIWNKFIRPALSDKRGWSLHTSTPEGKNHFYEMWQRGQDPLQKAWASWRLPSWYNTAVFPLGRQDPEILDMESEMTIERFNQEIAAMFTDFVGRVFKNFDEEQNVADLAYNPAWPLFGATDYGYSNPFVWLAIQTDPFDNIYVLAEYRAVNQNIMDISRDLIQRPLATNAVKFYPDPEAPGDTNVLEKALRMKAGGNTGGLLTDRLDMIRAALKPMPLHVPYEARKPRLFINRTCTELIREMNDYRYPELKSELLSPSENPMKKDDHGPEALGRFFKGHYGRETRSNANVSRAKMHHTRERSRVA